MDISGGVWLQLVHLIRILTRNEEREEGQDGQRQIELREREITKQLLRCRERTEMLQNRSQEK